MATRIYCDACDANITQAETLFYIQYFTVANGPRTVRDGTGREKEKQKVFCESCYKRYGVDL